MKYLDGAGLQQVWGKIKSDFGTDISVSLNTTDYKLTIQLLNKAGTVLSTQTVDFPVESVVVSGSYDSTNKKIVLTLQNGNTIDIPVGGLISGLQTELNTSQLAACNSGITSTKRASYDSHITDTTIHVTSVDKSTWNGKYQKPSIGIPYNDLEDDVKASLDAADSALQSITGTMVTTALGYTPYNATNPSGYTSDTALSTAEINAILV